MRRQTLDYAVSLLQELVETPSPSGFCHRVRDLIVSRLKDMGYGARTTVWRNNSVELRLGNRERSKRGLCAHFDTLGLMIRHIEEDGTILPWKIGGFPWSAVEGEYVTVHTSNGSTFEGTIVFEEASTHIYGSEIDKKPREDEKMRLRLDATVNNRQGILDLGIAVGDFVTLDPRFRITDSGFIKSRHLDDKLGVALILAFLKELADERGWDGLDLAFFFTAAEEIGKGATRVGDIDELLLVDNAVVGDGQNSKENKVTICVSDSTGPFDLNFRQSLTSLAKDQNIPYVLDVYRRYGSDSETILKRGVDVTTGLIGFGIDASHSFERVHLEGIAATFNLMKAWVLADSPSKKEEEEEED